MDNSNSYYPGFAEIDLEKIINNTRQVRKLVGDKPQILGVVKANAYGHGLIPSALAILKGGATYLGTAQLTEAIKLADANIKPSPNILSWLYTPDAPFTEAIEKDIELSVGSFWAIEEIAKAVKGAGKKAFLSKKSNIKKAKIHLKMDIEFGRDGFASDDFDKCFQAVNKYKDCFDIKGLWTHFAMADIPEHPANEKHYKAYCSFVDKYIEYNGVDNMPLKHIASSAICLTKPEWAFDMVRPGILAYGLKTIDSINIKELGFCPAMKLVGKFSSVKDYKAYQGVSYGHKYITKSDTKIGVVPLGYADGLRWVENNNIKSYSVASGNAISSVGSVCMDQILYDLGSGASEKPGDSVEFFGAGENGGSFTADDFAKMVGTIGYNVITSIGDRVPRVYKGKSALGEWKKYVK
ncbi:MAG: alanine racemase [Bifidobacteriaceae bacterium]|jgi:alanine racemase|nr:alanine racemase [Bifidobacteriaceae bacterium]